MPEFILESEGSVGTLEFSDLDSFTQGYVECLFFTSNEPGSYRAERDANPEQWAKDVAEGRISEIPGDYGFADLAGSTLAEIVSDCRAFQDANAALLSEAYGRDNYSPEQAGRDFWFTRNGHGVGFWDRAQLEDDSAEYESLTAVMVAASRSGDNVAWGKALDARKALSAESIGERLTEACRAWREINAYLGDDDKVYLG